MVTTDAAEEPAQAAFLLEREADDQMIEFEPGQALVLICPRLERQPIGDEGALGGGAGAEAAFEGGAGRRDFGFGPRLFGTDDGEAGIAGPQIGGELVLHRLVDWLVGHWERPGTMS